MLRIVDILTQNSENYPSKQFHFGSDFQNSFEESLDNNIGQLENNIGQFGTTVGTWKNYLSTILSIVQYGF